MGEGRKADSLKKMYINVFIFVVVQKNLLIICPVLVIGCSARYTEKSERGSRIPGGAYPPGGMGEGRQSAGR